METTDPVVRALDALVGGGVRRGMVPLVLEVQEQLAAECGGRHRVVADSGHYLQVDRPDLVVDAVRELAG